MKKMKKAIAMIELIFSIVVMGIAMLAIPMITAQTMKGAESAMMQESVSAGAAELNMILAKPWDQNGTDEDLGSPILLTDSTNFKARSGIVDTNNSRTRFYGTVQPKASNNGYNADENDIGDFDGKIETLMVYNNETNNAFEGNYIDVNINMTTAVDFVPDNVVLAQNTVFNFDPLIGESANTTNIKRITTTLTSTTNDNGLADNVFANKQIVLHSFSCNIGIAKANTNGS